MLTPAKRQKRLCHPSCLAHGNGWASLPQELIRLVMQHYRAGLHKRMLLTEIKSAQNEERFYNASRYDPDVSQLHDSLNSFDDDEASDINRGVFKIARALLAWVIDHRGVHKVLWPRSCIWCRFAVADRA